MPHFFINSKDIKDSKITVREDYNHIAKSLRARVGELLLLIDENQIQYETVIEEITAREIVAGIKKHYPSKRMLPFGLYLAQAPLRSEAQNFIIEKATELGAAGIYPVMTDNCAVKKSVVDSKIAKWQRIACEASKQCERAIVPEIFAAVKLEDLLRHSEGSTRLSPKNLFDKIIVFYERGVNVSLKKFLCKNPVKTGEKILVIIGPEGGFSQAEFEYFNARNIPAVTLGDLILKAETAVIAALGNIVYEYNK
jgi:16S rRNA (uracil1498-N3)-methyltransferase